MFVSQFFKKIFIVLIFIIISGCSIITAGYNRLPFLTLLELNSIFDLADEQSQKVRPILESWLEWHRANHLPIHWAPALSTVAQTLLLKIIM